MRTISAEQFKKTYGASALPQANTASASIDFNVPVSNAIAGKPSFPASTGGGASDILPNIAKTFGNIPSSASNIAQGAIAPVNPLNTESPVNIGANVVKSATSLADIYKNRGALKGTKDILGGFADTYLKIGETIYGSLDKAYNALLDDPKKAITDATTHLAKIGIEDPLLIPTLLMGGKATGASKDLISTIASPVTTSTEKFVSGITNKTTGAIESTLGKIDATNLKQKLIDFAAPEADDATKTILRESKPSDVQKFVDIQEIAIKDPRAITPYEAIGDSMAEATKKLNAKLKIIGEKKSEIVKPLAKGLDVFDTKPIIDDLMSLKNRVPEVDKSLVSSIIEQARLVKTKAGADKFVNDIQDLIYKGGRDNTIPKGSAVEKQLRGVLGRFNTALKDSLPPEYAKLNAQYSSMVKVVDALNGALGEVVDGVSTRGGSLIKQFFSPNGRKAKVLFDYVKKTTGIDLAKDATLARYIMELYGDSRANTLLGGKIPTSVSGALGKAVDFAVEKTGLGKSLQEASRKGAIIKAKKLTK